MPNKFISYPKSGRTWVKCLVGKYLIDKYDLDQNIEIYNLNKITKQCNFEKISFSHNGTAARQSYNLKHANKDIFKNYSVLLLIRNPFDIIVSYYFQLSKRNNRKPYGGNISSFIRSKHGIDRVIRFYSDWERQSQVPFYFDSITYENLHSNPVNEIMKVLNVIGETEIDLEILNASIEYCSFENMHEKEKNKEFNNKILQAKDLNDPESYKTRKGKSNNFNEYLSEEDIEYIKKRISLFPSEWMKSYSSNLT